MVQFRRVKKEDIKIDTFVKPNGLMECLECWKVFMSQDDRDLSASRMRLDRGDDESANDGEPVAYESDPYEDQRKADMHVGEAVNAMIYSLRKHHQWGIEKSCSVRVVWNFPSLDYLITLEVAQNELESKLRKNLVTAIKF